MHAKWVSSSMLTPTSWVRGSLRFWRPILQNATTKHSPQTVPTSQLWFCSSHPSPLFTWDQPQLFQSVYTVVHNYRPHAWPSYLHTHKHADEKHNQESLVPWKVWGREDNDLRVIHLLMQMSICSSHPLSLLNLQPVGKPVRRCESQALNNDPPAMVLQLHLPTLICFILHWILSFVEVRGMPFLLHCSFPTDRPRQMLYIPFHVNPFTDGFKVQDFLSWPLR